MDDLRSTEDSQDFNDFVEHISRDVRFKDGLLIGNIAELPLEYVITGPDDICVDSLQFSRDECAVQVGEPRPRGFKGTLFIIEPAFARPGYARLRNSDYGMGSKFISFAGSNARRNRKWLNSYTEDLLLDFLGMKNPGKQPGLTGRHLFGLNNMKLCVHGAVTCPSWPQEAAEWRTRRRPNGWPTQDLLENIVKGGCHLEPFRGSSFSNDTTAFRYSFARAEVALIYSWTPVQKYIYHVLLLIKSDVVRQLELQGHKNLVDAYHFKTLMLWACETKPRAFWTEDRIKSSVGELLCQMIEFLVDGNCPHYFMPNVNLMESRQGSPDVETIIMPLLVFKEQGAARLIAAVPMANPRSRSTVQISHKLMNVCQIGLRSVNRHAGYRRAIARFSDAPPRLSPAHPMEFSSLFNGVSAHLRLATNLLGNDRGPSTAAAATPGGENDYEMALIDLERATSEESSTCTFVRRQISVADAIPEIISGLFFADKTNPEISLMLSGRTLTDVNDGESGKSYRDTVRPSSKNFGGHEAIIMAKEAAMVQSEDALAKMSSLNPTSRETDLGNVHTKRGPVEESLVPSGQNMALTVAMSLVVPAFDRMLPKASRLVSDAYRANFYYSYCHDYQLALQTCDESLLRFRSIPMQSVGIYLHDVCSVALTPKWMPIFDRPIQAVYGFLALSNSLSRIGRKRDSAGRSVEFRTSPASDSQEVGPPSHYISPLEFLDYIKMQCEAKLIEYRVRSGLRSSCRRLPHWSTVAQRSQFILDAAIRISTEESKCAFSDDHCKMSVWNPFPTTRNLWYQ